MKIIKNQFDRIYMMMNFIKFYGLYTCFEFKCILCDQEIITHKEDLICSDCCKEIQPLYKTGFCLNCGKNWERKELICPHCKITDLPYERLVFYTDYENKIKQLIKLYKYKNFRRLKFYFVEKLFEIYQNCINDIHYDFMIPVPSFKKKEFDPIREITAILSKKLGIEHLHNNLFKSKNTVPQVSLTRAQRLKNLKNAFELKNIEQVKGKNILLVDDVCTTQTTIKECCKLLNKNNCKVSVITIARTPCY